MTSLAVVAGAAVWLVILTGTVVWLAVVALARGVFFGPGRIVRWLLNSWLSRIMVLAVWGLAGWHVFCQRP
jgi:hypothetical protein